jgi:hypothetical protein
VGPRYGLNSVVTGEDALFPPTAVRRAIAQGSSPSQAMWDMCWVRIGFLRVLRFPLPVLIQPTLPHSPSSISGGGRVGQIVADVRSGLSQRTQRNKKMTPPPGIELLHRLKNITCFSSVSWRH